MKDGIHPRDDLLKAVHTAIDVCELCQALIDAVRRDAVTDEQLAGTEQAVLLYKGTLTCQREQLDKLPPDESTTSASSDS